MCHRPPQVKLPAGACDTHAHVCGPTAVHPLVPNRLYNPPEASLAEYRHMLDTLGIERAVLVQPSVYGYLIGPNDLAYEMTGQRGAQTPEVMQTIQRVAERLRQDKRPFGLPANWNQLPYFQSLGANFLYFPLEWLVQHALHDLRAALNLD